MAATEVNLEQQPSHAAPPESPPVVLLIDDAPLMHRLLAARLKDEGVEVIGAFDGQEGLDLAQLQRPSIVLLDLDMPNMHGFEILRALKNDPRTIGLPVIIVSGSGRTDDKVRAFELGAIDFVTKPFDAAELRARIHSALRLMRLLRLLEQRAQIDGLTGLWNRTYFNERLASEINSATRMGQGVALVICDLDHFKKLNDTFGHTAGDAVLQGFASILLRELRSCDVACRYGGEEFALILPHTSLSEAVTACERIRTALEAQRWRKFPGIRATGSFGVTTSGVSNLNDPTAWVEAADRALYSAKDAGRNRVHVYNPRLDAGCAPDGQLRRAG